MEEGLTSLVGAMVAGITAAVVKQQRPKKRPYPERVFPSMAGFSAIKTGLDARAWMPGLLHRR